MLFVRFLTDLGMIFDDFLKMLLAFLSSLHLCLVARFQNDFWDVSDIPFIKDAQANIFCKVDETFAYHTHKIVIGSVTHSQSADTFNTLMYADGGYLD